MTFEAKHAIQNAVNAILNNEPDARKAIDSGGRAIYIHEATDTEGDGPDIKVTLIIDNATPADYFENEDGEIFDERQLEEDANRIIYELQDRQTRREHNCGNCGGCRKCRK